MLVLQSMTTSGTGYDIKKFAVKMLDAIISHVVSYFFLQSSFLTIFKRYQCRIRFLYKVIFNMYNGSFYCFKLNIVKAVCIFGFSYLC